MHLISFVTRQKTDKFLNCESARDVAGTEEEGAEGRGEFKLWQSATNAMRGFSFAQFAHCSFQFPVFSSAVFQFFSFAALIFSLCSTLPIFFAANSSLLLL